ncbi:UrcA family protein [Novosphingobium chloroacetimidivorans]|uniref:UrcA family protein n=1 Tax=Novosphingobium chloroacetimidivorans TaxID=1428314 RepID=A0A7W7K8B9_9SPHN|nr:UrcA family protein [Novosphingobium chloroacetimidivorans]MBB4857835.1 UrcA family protein [Novosphingobium chloroacetimidivorans]
MIKIAPVAAAIAAAALGIAAPAFANDVTVTYKDLDLSSAKDQKTLARRMDAAAKAACGLDDTTTGSRLVPPSAKACYKDAKSRSQATLATLIGEAQVGG